MGSKSSSIQGFVDAAVIDLSLPRNIRSNLLICNNHLINIYWTRIGCKYDGWGVVVTEWR